MVGSPMLNYPSLHASTSVDNREKNDFNSVKVTTAVPIRKLSSQNTNELNNSFNHDKKHEHSCNSRKIIPNETNEKVE